MERTERIDSVSAWEETANFEEIYEAYFDRIFRFVAYRLADRESVRDVTADIFQKVYTNFSAYDAAKGRFEVWIFSIARNTLYDYYRRQARRKWLPLENLIHILPSEERVEDRIERAEEHEHLRKIIRRQSERDQLLLSYKFGAELSNADIAALMALTPNHVGVLLHRLLKKIQREMEAYYEES